ncbi:MAG: hypothetical protein Q9188_003864 [Gyalolechia gomerana]
MALFSGGRYIRSKLRAGLASSLASLPSVELGVHAGLSFWDFPSGCNGEDLKLEYKTRVTALSAELTQEERADIVAEGVSIMICLIDMVHEIAEVVPSRVVALALQAPLEVRTGFQAPVARKGPPWNSLLSNLFPVPFR